MSNNTPTDPKKEKKTSFGEQLGKDIADSGKAFVKKSVEDAKNAAKQTAWNSLTGTLDIIQTNLKRMINSIIYPDGTGPTTNGNGESYHDYASYSSSSRYKYLDRGRERDIGERSSLDVQLMTFRSEEDVKSLIADIYTKIDANFCRMGDLYDMSKFHNMLTEQITPSLSDWKYGWSDKDKGKFDARYIPSGRHAGEWMLVTPKPHIV